MEIPFASGAYQGRSTLPDMRECLNLFPEPDNQGGQGGMVLKGAPGLTRWCWLGVTEPVRGMLARGDSLYAVCGNTLYQVDGSAGYSELGSLSTNSGAVGMACNGDEIMLVDGDKGYLLDLSGETPSFSAITDTDFPGGDTVAFIDGYFVVNAPGTGRMYCSSLYDGSQWNALDFGSAEAAPDDLVAVLADHRELWAFGEQSVEVFYNAGNYDFPFSRIQGAFVEEGCAAPHSAAKAENTVFWLSRNAKGQGRAMAAMGYSPKTISTPRLEHLWAGYPRLDDALGFTYAQEGHVFYVLTFPSADRTWCYDATTGFWHERGSFPDNGRHRANCHAFFQGKHLVGDFENGCIYELDTQAYDDDGRALVRRRVSPVLSHDRALVLVRSLEVEFETGVGLEDGAEPVAMLSWSDDDGRTWSGEQWAGLGRMGEYGGRVVWRRLGRTRSRVFALTVSDPVKVVVLGAHVRAEAMGS